MTLNQFMLCLRLALLTFCALAVSAASYAAFAGDPCRLEIEKVIVEPFDQDGKYGYRLPGGTVLIEPRFDVALRFPANGRAAVMDGESWAYVDRLGATLLRPRY